MADDAKKKILTYLLLAFALSSIFYYLILARGKLGDLTVLGLMWCPGVAGLATRLIYQKNLRGIGWGWGRTRYQVAAYLVPLTGGLLVYGIAWLTGLGGFKGALSSRPLPVSLLLLATAGFLLDAGYALGEELGWRGLLVPELAKVTGFGGTVAISAAIWALYHYPLILFADYHSAAPLWWSLLFFTLDIAAFSAIFAWLRLRSGSVWTGMILHASHNLFLQEVFDPLTVNRGKTEYWTTEFGLGMTLFYGAVAWWCWRRRGEVERTL
ncbi:MAG TPA: type II CAAX endopeptidase family protein [Thermoanaerobaculia bacterium]|nr:type II CAAX endopeptidase family protein [Thermoanaerobaculia bacterium]